LHPLDNATDEVKYFESLIIEVGKTARKELSELLTKYLQNDLEFHVDLRRKKQKYTLVIRIEAWFSEIIGNNK
jgi:septum formation topological specificity factor MinE